jgi:hypothetical protein
MILQEQSRKKETKLEGRYPLYRRPSRVVTIYGANKYVKATKLLAKVKGLKYEAMKC